MRHIAPILASAACVLALWPVPVLGLARPSVPSTERVAGRSQSSALIRTVHVGVHPLSVSVDERAGHVYVVSQDDKGQGSVAMLAAATGKALRTVRLGTLNVLGPGPAYYFNSPEPTQVVAVDQASGRVFVVNAGRPDTAPNSSPVQGPGSVYVLDAATGALLRTVRVGFGAMAVATDERSGRVFVADVFENQGHGTVDVLDAYSGRVLRVVPLRLGAATFAVDAVGGHVFVGGPLGVSMLDAAGTGRLVAQREPAIPGGTSLYRRGDGLPLRLALMARREAV